MLEQFQFPLQTIHPKKSGNGGLLALTLVIGSIALVYFIIVNKSKKEKK